MENDVCVFKYPGSRSVQCVSLTDLQTGFTTIITFFEPRPSYLGGYQLGSLSVCGFVGPFHDESLSRSCSFTLSKASFSSVV